MTGRPIGRVVVFGDTWGASSVVNALPDGVLCGLVAAEIRPQYLSELNILAERLAVPLVVQVKPASSGYAAFVERIKGLAPELIIVCSYAMLVREQILTLPQAGAVNVHGGLLPQYRGCNPIQWALLNNEIETGVTMHYMTKDFDAGDIIAQRRVPMLLEDTWQHIQQRVGEATDLMLREELPKLLARNNRRMPQDECKARYYARRKPGDGKFDWHARVIDIYNLIRALVRPNPGAFCVQNGEKLVFDEYLTLQEVAGLKFGAVGRQRLETGRVRLEPVGSDTDTGARSPMRPGKSRDQTVAFHVLRPGDGRGLCTVVMSRFDYREGICELALRADDGGATGEIADAIRLALEFAVRELGLSRVSVRVEHNEIAARDVVQGIREPWEKLPNTEEAVVLVHRG